MSIFIWVPVNSLTSLFPPLEQNELEEIMRLVDLSVCMSVRQSVYTNWWRYAL